MCEEWLARACVKNGWHVCVLRVVGTCVCEEWLACGCDDV